MNLAGLVFLAGLMLALLLAFIGRQSNQIGILLAFFFVLVVLEIAILYYFPVNAHYEMVALKESIIKPFLYFFANVIQAILVLLGFAVYFFIAIHFIAIFVFFGITPFLFWEMAIMLPRFKRNDQAVRRMGQN